MIRQYLHALWRYSSAQFLVTLGLMLGSSLMSGVGIISLLPLLVCSGFIAEETDHGHISSFLNFFPAYTFHFSLIVLLIIFVGMISLSSILEYFKTCESARFQHGFQQALQNRLNQSLANVDWAYFLTQRRNHAHHMIVSGIPSIGLLTYTFFLVMSDSVFSISFLGISLFISPTLTLAACGICIGILCILPLRKFISKGNRQFDLDQSIQEEASHFLDGIKLSKSCNQSTHYLHRFAMLTQQYHDYNLLFVRLQSRAKSAFLMMSSIIFSTLFFMGASLLHLPIIHLLGFLLIFSRLAPRFQSLYHSASRLLHLLPWYARAIDMMTEFEAHCDVAVLAQPISLTDVIEFRDVSFSYTYQEALYRINCQFKANTTTAIVGMSGAGKSTMADLLLGLLSPTHGQIMVDGCHLDSNTIYSFRECVGYVPQESHLFHDTIRNNLIWAAPTATDDMVWDALRQAALDQVIDTLPQKLDTLIGDRGIRLSGGERQRLALARALLRHPQILILDEATSSLDYHHEELIYRTLRHLHGKLTLIVIAHRLTTIQNADHVLVLSQGKLIESGSASQLSGDPTSAFSLLFSKQGHL